eukprot:7165244-Prymnesium_polylepis.1
MAEVVMKKRPTTSEHTSFESEMRPTDGAHAVSESTAATSPSMHSSTGLRPMVSESALPTGRTTRGQLGGHAPLLLAPY